MNKTRKEKEKLAVTRTINVLGEKGYEIFVPILSNSLRYDLLITKDNKNFFKIQCKYSSDGKCNSRTVWSNKNGSHILPYKEEDFDYYALYLPDIDKVVFPSIKFLGCIIASKHKKTYSSYYYFENFLELTDTASKINNPFIPIKKRKEIKITEERRVTCEKCSKDLKNKKGKYCVLCQKTFNFKGPSKEILEKEVWELPSVILAKKYNVSGKAIEKWCKKYNISKPPRGYWQKQKKNK